MKKEILMEIGKRYPQIGPTVIITFANTKEGIADLRILWNLVENGRISMQFNTPTIVAAVLLSSDWGMDMNRKIAVRFPLGFALRDEFTLDSLSRLENIESIRNANENPLNALMTGRQKRQTEVAEEIIRQIMTQEVIDEVSSWGFAIDAALDTTIKELPGIKINISNEDEIIFTILLDAWSGGILINGSVKLIRYADAKQIEKLICELVLSHVEKATA